MKKNKYLIAGVCVLVLLFVFGGYKPEFWKHLLNLIRPINQTGTVYPAVTTPVTPYVLWNAEGANATIDAMGHNNLVCDPDPAYTPCTNIAVANGPVGKYLNFPETYGPSTTPITWPAGSFTIEFIMNPSLQFARGLNGMFSDSNGQWDISFSPRQPGDAWDNTTATINFSTGGDNWKVALDGSNTRSIYWTDNNWHHFAFVYDAVSGTKEVWIDGQAPGAGLSKSISGGMPSSGIYFSNANKWRKFTGGLDEIAIYKQAVPRNLILEHYNNFQSGNHYATTTSIVNVPGAPNTALAPLDAQDFPTGADLREPVKVLSISNGNPAVVTTAVPHLLVSGDWLTLSSTGSLPTGLSKNTVYYVVNPTSTTFSVANSPGGSGIATSSIGSGAFSYSNGTPPTTQTPIQQLSSMVLPRFKSNSGIQRNFLWMDPAYTGMTSTNSSASSIAQNAKLVNLKLAQDFNYGLQVGWGNSAGISYAPGTLYGELAKLGNDNPTLPTDLVTLRIQQVNTLWSQNFPADHYLQTSSGSKIYGLSGCQAGAYFWRPGSKTPWQDYQQDGITAKAGIDLLISQMPARTGTHVVDRINDNDEIVPYFDTGCLNQDTLVVNEAAAAGKTVQQFAAAKYSENYRKAFRDIIFSNPKMTTSVFTDYNHSGWINAYGSYSMDWPNARDIQTPVNGNYYSTQDFYVRWQNNWQHWGGAWHGFGALEYAKRGEIESAGDKFSSPFVSAGWENNITQNVLFPSYLGMMKSLAGLGAEFFYAGNFNSIGQGIVQPSTYIWQAAAPAYAQAITSREFPFYNSSNLMQGDLPINNADSADLRTNYRFASQDPRIVTRVRKAGNGSNKYMIFTTVQPYNNHRGSAPTEKNSTIKLDGQNTSFETRQQGSVYVYDNTNTAQPVFYQLDRWHEPKNPSHWSSDFKAEAEVMDSGTATIKTEGAGVALKNFTPGNYDSYVNPGSGTTLTYIFQPRNATSSGTVNRYAYIRARSLNGTSASAQLQVDALATKTISVSSGSFCWIKADTTSVPLLWTGITENADHNFKFIGQSTNFAFDQFILSSNANLAPGTLCTGGGGDTVSPVVSITAPTAGANVSGSAVTISANASDTSGIQSVVFKVDGVDVGQDTSSPYQTSWDSNTATNGTHSITAVATDASPNNNVGASSAVSVTVNNADTIAPSIPANLTGARSGNNAVLTWGASTDTGGSGLAGYKVYKNGSTTALNGTIITGLTYTDTAPTPNTAHTYTVKAFDVAGNSSNNSNTATVTIDTLGPTTTMTAPANGATLVGSVNVSATISDPSGVNHVDFYRSGNPATIVCSTSTGSGSTYSCSWNTANTADGTYNIYAMAYDNATPSNSTTTSTSALSVTLNNNPVSVDTVAPTTTMVAITGTQSGTITLGANSTDAGNPISGVQYVQFFVDDVAIVNGSDTTGGNPNPPASLYQITWNTASVTNGTHQIKAKGYDNAGNNAFSNTISITVNNVAGLPDVIITDITMSPTSVTPNSPVIFSAIVKNQGTAPTPAGIITGVSFYVDTQAGPYVWSDTYTQSIPAGASVTLTVNGGTAGSSWSGGLGSHTVHGNVDDVNRYTESNEANNLFQKSFTISNDTTAPIVTLTSPVNNQQIVRGTTVTMSVNATDNVGVTKVEYYRNGQLRCTVTTAPFSCDWSTWLLSAKGNVTMYAKAYDAANNIGISPTITVKKI